MTMVIYIAAMAGVTYLIRMIPFTLFRKRDQAPADRDPPGHASDGRRRAR